jgi:hypothetical protein
VGPGRLGTNPFWQRSHQSTSSPFETLNKGMKKKLKYRSKRCREAVAWPQRGQVTGRSSSRVRLGWMPAMMNMGEISR